MDPRDIAHQVVEAVAGDAPRAVEVDTRETLHNVGMIRDLEIGNDGFAELLALDVLAVVTTHRDRRIDDVRNGHHVALDLLFEFGALGFERGKARRLLRDLLLRRLGFLALPLPHQHADLFRDPVAVGADIVALFLRGSAARVEFDHLVDEREFLILKLLFDVLFYNVGILPDKTQIKHFFLRLYTFL